MYCSSSGSFFVGKLWRAENLCALSNFFSALGSTSNFLGERALDGMCEKHLNVPLSNDHYSLLTIIHCTTSAFPTRMDSIRIRTARCCRCTGGKVSDRNPPPPPREQKHACQNIAFPILRMHIMGLSSKNGAEWQMNDTICVIITSLIGGCHSGHIF